MNFHHQRLSSLFEGKKKHGIDNRIYSASGLINTRLLEIVLYAYTSSHL